MNTPYKILFLCTGNSARSILSEFLTNEFFPDKFEAYSAGSQPKPDPHPVGLSVLQEDFKIDTSSARSKSWDEFKDIHFDFVLTLCDDAKESCPLWPGQPVLAHWRTEDPSDAPESEQRKAFSQTAQLLRYRIELLASLPIDKLDRLKLETETQSISTAQKPTD
ncbi:arsenate reductase ArsC [Kiritimatiellaeota bacterium B1221]|nr:arsenate reductase ArsC [Kiritimatiellaeota bacterium B1221]